MHVLCVQHLASPASLDDVTHVRRSLSVQDEVVAHTVFHSTWSNRMHMTTYEQFLDLPIPQFFSRILGT